MSTIPALETQPLIDLTSGYVLRSIDAMPRQGMRAPWRLHQNYARDIRLLRHGALQDGAMGFFDAGAGGGALDGLDSVAEPAPEQDALEPKGRAAPPAVQTSGVLDSGPGTRRSSLREPPP